MRKSIVEYFKKILEKKDKTFIDKMLTIIHKLAKKFITIFANTGNKNIDKMYLHARALKRKITGDISFVSLDELFIWTENFCKSFSCQYDLIIGVPRSGLIVANIIALKLGKPLAVIDQVLRDEYWKSGLMQNNAKIKKVLLIDDSINTGKSMREQVERLKHRSDLEITTAALIATREATALVDIYYKIIPQPRIFEWNLLHSKKGDMASDLDGVICENCPPGVDSNEEAYIDWINNAKPYLIPHFQIDTIITNRLEIYRKNTERWLRRNNVDYFELKMWNIQKKEERQGRYSENKVNMVLEAKPHIVWESDYIQSKEIWEKTRIPTICIDEMCLFG